MIIITGGAGFIGSVLCWYLNKQGITDIILVDSLKSTEKWKNLRGLRFSDYLEKEEFIELIRSGKWNTPTDALFHLGACSSTTETNASYLVQNNFSYTRDLALYAVQKNIRFIYASSAATYGGGEHGYDDDEQFLIRLKPLNMYGFSKHMFDLWAQKHGLLDKIVGLKYFNVYGPNEYHKGEMRSLICKAVEQIKTTGRLRLFKSYRPEFPDGEQKRDFIYVKDAVKMTAFFLLENRSASGIFNLGTGETHSWNELARAVFKGMNQEPVIEYIDMPDSIREKYQYFTQANINKLRDAGYRHPITPFEDAVVDYVRNYLIKDGYITDESHE